MAGCMSFAPDPPPVITKNPTQSQLQFCHSAMYIDPNIKIAPVGFYYQEHFLDDEAAFKFNATANNASEIFQTDFIPAQKLVSRG